MRRIQSTLLLLALTVMSVSAKVRLPHLIGDNMVIQQLADVRLWGWTDAGKEVKVTVWRDGARQDFTVKLGDRSENLTADNAIRGRSGDASTAEATLGLTLRPLRAEEAKALKIEQGGMVIVSIEDDKPAGPAEK